MAVICTERNSKIGFWRRRLRSNLFVLARALLESKAARSGTKNWRGLLAKFPILQVTSV